MCSDVLDDEIISVYCLNVYTFPHSLVHTLSRSIMIISQSSLSCIIINKLVGTHSYFSFYFASSVLRVMILKVIYI